ncbi:MAG: hypothetical protein GY928_23860 [Colwellia sp.]|nr:hypothetical protein [Colwellia sp.]
MKTTIHLYSGLLTTGEKDHLIEHTSFNESYFERRKSFEEWRCNEKYLIQEEMDLEKLVKLSRYFGIEVDGEDIYLEGKGF